MRSRPAPEGEGAPVSVDLSPDELLAHRLSLLGLPPVTAVRTHTNCTVMVSLTPRRVLRVHRGYVHAPDRVLSAIVRFLKPGTRRSTRAAARRELLAFPVDEHAPRLSGRGPERPRPADLPLQHRLERLHQLLNAEYFEGRLSSVPIRLSGRMRTRLGEVRADRGEGHLVAIALSRRHLRRDSWVEVTHTMLHEMVHQWQVESGYPLDHGSTFRRKARQVGIDPRAVLDQSRELAARDKLASETGSGAR
ncbi:MAG: SprT-like domain-containing protein [Gemmatimonadales bacterium]